jgi:hypothetical protein
MKKISSLVLIILVAASLNGCATPNTKGIDSKIKAPLSLGDHGATFNKTGTATATSILGLGTAGDASIKAAAANGGIKTIKHVNYEAKNVLGIYGEYTTTVYGD